MSKKKDTIIATAIIGFFLLVAAANSAYKFAYSGKGFSQTDFIWFFSITSVVSVLVLLFIFFDRKD